MKKMPKLEQKSVNLLSPMNMPIHEEYAIKNEIDHDFMNSPIRNDYSNPNVNLIYKLNKVFIL